MAQRMIDTDAVDHLALADWRRRVADVYGEVRAAAAVDPASAWRTWRDVRERLFREHPESPVPAAERSAFQAHHWPYDPTLRFDLAVIREGEGVAVEPAGSTALAGSTPAGSPDAAGASSFGAGFGSLSLPLSTGGEQAFTRIGWIDVPFAAGTRRLGLYWMAGYAGGLFLPFRDATNGNETYGAGRYLLDSAKGADLGGDAPKGTLTLDFNFSFHPSCAFDPRWSCPLSPLENRLDIRVEAGERLR